MKKPGLFQRLVRQLRARGVKSPHRMANGLMNKFGHKKKGTTKLTSKGKKKSSMSAGARAKKRASERSGKPVSAYKYNPKTNRATLKRKTK